MTKARLLIFSIACILTGSLLFYFQGYKDNWLIKLTAFLIGIIGWFILYDNFSGHFEDFHEKKGSKTVSNFKRGFFRLLFRLLLFATVVGNMILVTELTNKRVDKILETEPIQLTFATITKFDERYSKTGSQHYVIIVYNVNDKLVHQAIYDYNRRYIIGQKVKIIYSTNYPEMFKVADTNE